MKKLVAIVGSPRGTNSETYKLISNIIKVMKNKNKNLSAKIFNLSDLNIHECIGCSQCFLRCSSCVNFNDSMTEIEEALIQSDFIIFGSPVYAHNVTSEMKKFIDRISHFIHIMKFTGKYGLAVSTSSSNGNVFVNNYLVKIMECLGIKIVDSISYMSLLEFDEQKLSTAIQTSLNLLNNKLDIKASEHQERNFIIFKNAYSKLYENSVLHETNLKNQEALYWVENGYLNFNSFEELFNSCKTS